MTLEDIFEQLTYGELSQLSMGGWQGEKVRPEDVRKVLAHVNLGLRDLYTRFWLKSGEIILSLSDHIAFYKLHNKYAISNTESTEITKYIIDSKYKPFQNDILKIEEIFNQCGEVCSLNDKTNPCSFYTPSYDTIQVPQPFDGAILSVQYRANHRPVIWDCVTKPEEIDIDLPEAFFEPLLLFVGYRAMRALNSDQNQESNNYLQQYELACQRIKNLGYEITSNLTNMKLDCNGWV